MILFHAPTASSIAIGITLTLVDLCIAQHFAAAHLLDDLDEMKLHSGRTMLEALEAAGLVSVRRQHVKPLATSGRLQLYLSGTLLLAALCPRSTHAQATTVLATVRDSTGAPIFPSRIEVIGTVITERGDSLGRVVLRGVPRGLHQLAV